MPKWGYNFPASDFAQSCSLQDSGGEYAAVLLPPEESLNLPKIAAMTAMCSRSHSTDSMLPGNVIYIFACFLTGFDINALEHSVISALEAIGELVCMYA